MLGYGSDELPAVGVGSEGLDSLGVMKVFLLYTKQVLHKYRLVILTIHGYTRLPECSSNTPS